MSTECYPISTLLPTTRLYRDYLAMGEDAGSALHAWYGAEPMGARWMHAAASAGEQTAEHRAALADALTRQSEGFGAGPEVFANIERLRNGARAIVTGQQVGLFGGPALTLLKAATAIARAKQTTAATGIEHVPIFWLATEDHDLAEVNQAALLTKTEVETLKLSVDAGTAPVGSVALRGEGEPGIDALLDQASELLGYTPVSELLRECYGAGEGGATFGSAFARLMVRLFGAYGLIVLDAEGREFHGLGAQALRYAIEHAEKLEQRLLERTLELERAGYHAQVLVKPGASLLFLISESEGMKTRQALRRASDGMWKAGNGAAAKSYTTAELLAILEAEPERLSPNALLRPVFQDTILPTTAYVGGPSEVAYFAQSAVICREVMQRITPVLPRLSATLIEPAIEKAMEQHEVALPDAMRSADELAQRLGARAMPIETKRKLASAGNALDDAVTAAEEYLSAMDASLGRSAAVSGSKMRYQMNRLRRLAATFELNKEASLRKHAEAITLHLYPEGHAQERLLAGVWFLAAWEAGHGTPATELIERIVETAQSHCPGHLVIRI